MANPEHLPGLQALIPEPDIVRRQGIITGTASALTLNVDGNTIPYRCVDPLVVTVGDTVAVDFVGGRGQSEAWVIGRLTAAFRPATGTVKTVPPSSITITVTGTDGTDYTAYFLGSYTPTVGDNVNLSWAAAVPSVMGKVGATAAAYVPAPVAAPPGPSSTGSTPYQAADSATYSSFGWDAWAGGGGNVYQGGAAYGGPTYGSWFYAGSPTELAGRTITGATFRIGSRRPVGDYNQPVTVHLYAHNSNNRPGSGDVQRVQGPYDATIQPGAGPTDIVFGAAAVAAIGPVFQSGGGISIAGESYAGFLGCYAQPDSGLLTLNWSR